MNGRAGMNAATRRQWAKMLLERMDDEAYTITPLPDGRVRIEPDPPAALIDDVLAVREELADLVHERDARARQLVEGAEARGLAVWWSAEESDLCLGWHRIPDEAELTPAGLNGLLVLLAGSERAVENFCRRTGRTAATAGRGGRGRT